MSKISSSSTALAWLPELHAMVAPALFRISALVARRLESLLIKTMRAVTSLNMWSKSLLPVY